MQNQYIFVADQKKGHMIKMIASDMDGTLLNSKKQLPKDFTEVYALMKAADIRFVVASGRQYYTLVDEFAHLDHDIAFIAENGSIINFDGESKVLNAMYAEDLTDLINALRSHKDINIVLCGKSGAYIENDSSPEFMTEVAKYYVKNTVVKDLLEVKDEVLKIAVNGFNKLEANVYPFIREQFKADFQVSSSSPIWFDIMPIGINKGEAIVLLQKELGIQADESMAFGDYHNDIELLQKVKHSYAMDNAHADIKEIARYTTDSNDENGVMNAIRAYLAKNLKTV